MRWFIYTRIRITNGTVFVIEFAVEQKRKKIFNKQMKKKHIEANFYTTF